MKVTKLSLFLLLIVGLVALSIPVVAQQLNGYPTPGPLDSLPKVEPTGVSYLTPEAKCQTTGKIFDSSCSPEQKLSIVEIVKLPTGESISCSGDDVQFLKVVNGDGQGESMFLPFDTRIHPTELSWYNDGPELTFWVIAPYSAGCMRFALPGTGPQLAAAGVRSKPWTAEQMTSLTFLRIQQHLSTGDALDRYTVTPTAVPNCESIDVVIEKGPQGVDCDWTNVGAGHTAVDGSVDYPYYGVFGQYGFIAMQADNSLAEVFYVDLHPTPTPTPTG